MPAITALLALTLLGAAPPAEKNITKPEEKKVTNKIDVTLLHINDTHGRILAYTEKNKKVVGGYARLATLISDIRTSSKSDRVFLVHAGDILSRGDKLTRKTLGAANIELLNHLKFDFWTPGNGEFYDGLKVLQDRIAQANFNVLTANVKLEKTGKTLGKPYIIERAGDVRIAFVGLCLVRKRSLKGLDVTEAKTAAQELVKKLKKQADVIIAVTHIGLLKDQVLAKSVEGIDVIIGGHSHSFVKEGLSVKNSSGSKTLICQAGDYMKHLGQVDLSLTKTETGWEVTKATAKLHAINEKIKIDPTVKALIAKMSKPNWKPTETKPQVEKETEKESKETSKQPALKQ